MSAIAPHVLFEQVRSTAAWALDGPASPTTSFRDALGDLDAATRAYPDGLPYFRALLAAHFCTVATFVPTDVDARIRHHAFTAMDARAIDDACSVIDEAARWDATLVSARVVSFEGISISGIGGEWLAVRAGALGRALSIGEGAIASRLEAAIDEELDREHALYVALEARGDALDVLRAATTIAHNLGDLSRVVDLWPDKPAHAIRAKYTRLGHDFSAKYDRFARAGALNKAVMAEENHRFLALRRPRALRRSRDLLLPIGPFFDDWGKTIATHASLDDRDRAEVVDALLALHASRETQRGCLRALAGIDAATRGGLPKIVELLPAKTRRALASGPLRDALKTPREAFEARMRKTVQRAI